MGYALAMGSCLFCNRMFGFNPMRVPSLRVSGVREPICQQCVTTINQLRVEKGLEPVFIHPDAYEPCHESELNGD